MLLLLLSDFNPTKNLLLDDSFINKLKSADKIVFNLEGTYISNEDQRKNTLLPIDKNVFLEFIDLFGREKFIISVANNHILDNGLSNFEEMIQFLIQCKINYFGTKDRPYFNIDSKCYILTCVTGETVATLKGYNVLSYLFYNTSRIQKQIEKLQQVGDCLIFYPHWGRDMDNHEFQTYTLKFQSDKWLIFGHHPHLIIENSNLKNIYSLGNTFIEHPSYYSKYPYINQGLIVQVDTNSKLISKHTTVISKENGKFHLSLSEYIKVEYKIAHSSTIKNVFLKLFYFSGSRLDFVRLITLQLLFYILKIIKRR